MSAPLWQPGTTYLPGAIVSPRSNTIVTQEQPENNSFESGLTNWTVSGQYMSNTAAQGAASASSTEAFDGSQSATCTPTAGNGTGPVTNDGHQVGFVVFTNNFMAPVTPGQKINFQMRAWHLFVPNGNSTYPYSAGARLAWYDAAHNFISYSYASSVSAGSFGPSTYPGMVQFQDGVWVTLSGTGTAPANAAYCAAVCVIATTNYSTQADYVDDFTWDYTHQGYPAGLVFVAVQSTPGTSSSVEPDWPVMSGQTVQDNSVTWEAEYASQITWTASSILRSGATQPTWPTKIGASVADGSIVWTATDGRVTDPNCPQSKIVAIGSAKIFAADDDIIRFSATANAQDWSSSQDAGYIPFGLQSYGNEPCKGLNLYRSNLVAFNSLGYQMWQIDPDPNNIAILDAEPVGCDYNRSIQPVNNDLVFLSPVGIRNIGTAGASGNLQAGQFGKQVDPIVNLLIKQLATSGYEPRSLFNPGTGQYWLLIGEEVIVLTINGGSVQSWSRYQFPAVTTDYTVQDGVLYLRAGDLVWSLDTDALTDDTTQETSVGGANIGFDGYMSWNYLEFGQIGVDKMMEGFDLTIGQIDDDGTIVSNDVTCAVSIGYNQSDVNYATEPYTVTGDTIPGTMIPMPLTAPSFQFRLDFGDGQDWGWGALNVYDKPLYRP